MTPGPVLERLRTATARSHKALETELGALERLASRRERPSMVARYHQLHAAADAAVAPWVAGIEDLDAAGRRRTPLLERDLAALGAPSPAAPAPLHVTGVAEALGLLYVLEGSTLGGRMIHKALLAKGCDLEGLSFLDPYGPETGARWRGFLEVLEREGAADPRGAERGAIEGFARARRALLQDLNPPAGAANPA